MMRHLIPIVGVLGASAVAVEDGMVLLAALGAGTGLCCVLLGVMLLAGQEQP